MKYVMSDIHGCYDKSIEMLKLIDFKDGDNLYIIGDIIDRGTQTLELVDYVIEHGDNITLIIGNHEQQCIDYYRGGDTLWFRNGGDKTNELLQTRGKEYIDTLCDFFEELPHVEVVSKFILVHATLNFPIMHNRLTLEQFLAKQDSDYILQSRRNINREEQYKDYIIICGHSTVQYIQKSNDNVKILKRHGTIYIDCGCVYPTWNGKLACLRLDDMEEFYI